MDKKGQIISFDAIIAAFIMLLIFGFSMNTYNNITTSIEENVFMQKIQLDSINSIDKIFNDTNCEEFGLITDKEISQSKIDCVSIFNYSTIKEILSIEEYEFHFKLTNTNGILLEKGIQGTKRSFPVQRFGIMNGKIVKGVFVLYEK